ncbi:MAG TPA: ThuA domain-containing protein, partial [Polyangiaceae bacterium]|nr:ThuA domain-containing protein [Polyangiaceae bacterium]
LEAAGGPQDAVEHQLPEFGLAIHGRGVPATWSVRDEWFRMHRDIGEQPGFQIVARLAADNRPVVWIKDFGGQSSGRMFYTIRGHAPAVYREAEFRQLVLNGILWATRRLE